MTSNLKNKPNWKNGIYKDELKDSKTNKASLFSATCNVKSISIKSNIQEEREELPQSTSPETKCSAV